MDFITKKMMEIEDLQPNNLTHVDHSLRPQSLLKMVGFDDHLYQILDKLTGQQSTLQAIPITGMGGIGKTKLAQNVYGNSLIVKHFDIRGWVTVSQVYNIKQMLLDILCEIGVTIDKKEKEKENSEYHHLGKILYQHLSGRMYLITVDDLWNIEAWDKLKLFLPDTKGSRILVTTRLKDVANYVGYSNMYEINLLDENKSWSLLYQKIFGQEACPRHELEEVGKEIAKKCQGLPLSIVVIGGLLVKSKMTLDFCEYVANNVNKTISSEDGDCLDILLLSYKQLPIHLQPCFLYMGVFLENHTIHVSELINLWVAEGFLKPNKLKTLEEIAEEYLKDLTERNLIMVNKWGSLGTMKTCNIHDLLRDLCLREAHKEKFFSFNKVKSESIMEHRIVLKHGIFESQVRHASTLLVRSMTVGCMDSAELCHIKKFKLLRVLNVFINSSTPEGYINLLNLRILRLSGENLKSIGLVHRLWNLHTLAIDYIGMSEILTLQIWKMPQLRHLICIWQCIISVPDPQRGQIDDSVLKNLQTLSGIVNFRCTEEVVRRIPNVKELVLKYDSSSNETGSHYYYLNNIRELHKLQSLTLGFSFGIDYERINSFLNFGLPRTLKELALSGMFISLKEDIITRIGLLPYLEQLELDNVFTNEEWNPFKRQFRHLKVLALSNLFDLLYWEADSAYLPLLEHLHLVDMPKLEEIPSGIGEIATLLSITLRDCKASVVASAENILEEQQSFGNESFRLHIEEKPNTHYMQSTIRLYL